MSINKIWLSNIIEVMVENRKIYVCTIYDTNNSYLVTCKIGKRNNYSLEERTLNKDVEKHRNARPLIHSDRGFQYTREAFRNSLKDLGLTQSMSRVRQWPMESFQKIIKDVYKYQTAKKIQRKNFSTDTRRSYAFILARTVSNVGQLRGQKILE